jgi:hypothetical protein
MCYPALEDLMDDLRCDYTLEAQLRIACAAARDAAIFARAGRAGI